MAAVPDDNLLYITVNSEANSRRIAIVESCFGSSGQPLAVPGRVLVGEGVLTKMCRKKPKPRQFFLCNDILIYGNIVINKKKVSGFGGFKSRSRNIPFLTSIMRFRSTAF